MTPELFDTLVAEGYNRVPLMCEVLADLDTPLSAYLKLADGPYSYLFESVQGGEKWGRYSIIGLPCQARLEVRGRQVTRFQGEAIVEQCDVEDPLAYIESCQQHFKAAEIEGLPRFSGGLVGYFGYDTIRYIENKLAECPNPDELQTPDILLMVSDELVVFDNLKGRMFVIVHADPTKGDTLTSTKRPCEEPLPGFKQVQPRVFAGLFPSEADDYPDLREALDRLQLNDSALQFEPETSEALGFGFRCGFLGMLHMEIVQERLEREYDVELVTTAPTVIYEIELSDGEVVSLENPAKLPGANKVAEIREPIIEANILVPQDYVGSVIGLCEEKRGVQRGIHYMGNQVSIRYELPLSEVVLDFFDRLKSVSRGYASFEYHFLRFQDGPFVRVDVLINGERVDALSLIMHRDQAQRRGRELAVRMKDLIPRQMFEVAIQAAIGSKVIARSTVKALRKNVTAKCYGGDVTRKRKLLEKQKAGKKRMKQVGSLEIPQEAFLAVLRVEK